MRFKTNQQGFSLVSVLMAIGIGGIFAAVVSKIMTDQNKGQKRTELRANLLDIFRSLDEKIDCTATLNGIDLTTLGTSTVPVNVEVKSVIGTTTFIPVAGRKVGHFHMYADATISGVKIYAARLPNNTSDIRNATNFLNDPMTSKAWDWNYSAAIISNNDPTLNSYCTSSSSPSGTEQYQMTCFSTGSMLANHTCIRIDKTTGETSCRFENIPNWVPCTAPFAASPTPGNFQITCLVGGSNSTNARCIRLNTVTGSAECRAHVVPNWVTCNSPTVWP